MVILHLLAVATPLYTHARALDLATLFFTYNFRMFGITAGYHRLLAHNSFRTSRFLSLLLAVLGASSLQKGPLWWASSHRHHHRYADTEEDRHSPKQHGFLWSHIGWFLLQDEANCQSTHYIPDLRLKPELCTLERLHAMPAALLAGLLAFIGGLHAFLYGLVFSTVLLWHGTFLVKSFALMSGRKTRECEFDGPCEARNIQLIAILTLGEGHHHNHHAHMRSVKHGWCAHEVDVTFGILRCMHSFGLV